MDGRPIPLLRELSGHRRILQGSVAYGHMGITPGSWEHTAYFEAARALNEQRFSILKSMHVTGFSDLKRAARREPFVKIIIALMVASANKRVQDSWKQHPSQASSITMRMNQLEASLRRTPMKRPPRT